MRPGAAQMDHVVILTMSPPRPPKRRTCGGETYSLAKRPICAWDGGKGCGCPPELATSSASWCVSPSQQPRRSVLFFPVFVAPGRSGICILCKVVAPKDAASCLWTQTSRWGGSKNWILWKMVSAAKAALEHRLADVGQHCKHVADPHPGLPYGLHRDYDAVLQP